MEKAAQASLWVKVSSLARREAIIPQGLLPSSMTASGNEPEKQKPLNLSQPSCAPRQESVISPFHTVCALRRLLSVAVPAVGLGAWCFVKWGVRENEKG